MLQNKVGLINILMVENTMVYNMRTCTIELAKLAVAIFSSNPAVLILLSLDDRLLKNYTIYALLLMD